MKCLIFADCMAIDNQVSEDLRYPALLMQKYPHICFDLITLDGCTTNESIDKLVELNNYDMVIYGFGINNALPRGLKRKTRGFIIRMMYKMKFGKNLRLASRTYFLNPLEYLLQTMGFKHHYYSIEQTIEHITKIKEKFKGSLLIIIAINPIKNYRFLNANTDIKLYNQAIKEFTLKHKLSFVDVETQFLQQGLSRVLAKDLFHYSELGHQLVYNTLVEEIDRIYKGE